MPEWTSDEKIKHMLENMSRNQRRVYKKLIKKGYSHEDAVMKAYHFSEE